MTHKEIKLVLKTIVWTLFVLWMVWALWSWWDVVAHQLSGGTHNPMNMLIALGIWK